VQWQRALEVSIGAEDPDRWIACADQLTHLLCFMTDDAWDLSFELARPPAVQQLLNPPLFEQELEVALFSGGLDSVAGACARGRERRILAVSACGNEVRGRAQSAALDGLRRLGTRAESLKFAHQLRSARRKRSQLESSQRSRGLLFLAMGAATASHVAAPTFSVYETGVGCINLPMTAAQVGAEGTRAMHPHTLGLFAALVQQVLDRPVDVLAPFLLQTKGELCAKSGADLSALAALTMSCDEGEGHKPDSMEHCGLCTSCLFRRIAIWNAIGRDPTSYRDTIMRRHGNYELCAFDVHAAELAECKTLPDLLALQPDLRLALRSPPFAAMSGSGAGEAVLTMYQRYAREIRNFLEQSAPEIAPLARKQSKEVARALFAAAR